MKKILLLITLIVGLSLTFSAGKASASIMASSIVTGEFFLETLTITTTGTVVYAGTESTTDAYADSEDDLGVLTVDDPFDTTIFDWTTFNKTEAGVSGAYHAVSEFDPVYVDLTSDFDPASSMFADIDVYADDAGNDGFADAWTSLTGIVAGGSSGGTITISVEYAMSITLDTSLGYGAGGFSSVELGLYGEGASYDDDFYDLWLDAFDGFDDFDDFSSTLSVTLAFAAGEFGDFYLDVVSNGYAGPLDAVVPEPSTYLLLGAGIAGLIVWRRKRRKA
ncbi:hypothetical protein MNBD_DELTA01-872 [hydrothermal vent metagenome]|uniref:Ice-binding protein C-terminal domain-containing protein n=1 Tax=hydrothermal vent metagenome TaxID=652676 RepID=A0A3B0R9W4_9ZZZZ